ncbi:MAG TPA: hypothetical protein VFV50_02530 [Bdellovibrionales bacterium]|nr:hypothetical protein [Bdellovibrionales bacterium]
MKAIARIFDLDDRSLAAFRLVLGVLAALDTLQRLAGAGAFYSDAGVLSRAAAGEPALLKIYFLSGDAQVQSAFLVLQLSFALCFAAGIHARFFGLLLYAFLGSLHFRNPLVLSGSEMLMRLMLLWSLFLPIDARFARGPQPLRLGRWPSAVFMLQLAALYLTTVYYKAGPEWTRELSALSKALELPWIVKPAGAWLREQTGLTGPLTMVVFALELSAPLLALLPGRPRLLALLALFGLHAGIFLTLELGHFQFVIMAAWLAWLPAAAWATRPGRLLERALSRLEPPFAARLKSASARVTAPRERALWLAALALLAGLAAVRIVLPGDAAPGPVRAAASVLGVNQNWRMFAASTLERLEWVSAEGDREGAAPRELLSGGPVGWREPPRLSANYDRYLWRQYLSLLANTHGEEPAKFFAAYLCRVHEADRLTMVTIHFVNKQNAGPLTEPALTRSIVHACAL